MKYRDHGTQYPELRDYEPPKPQRLSPVFKETCCAVAFLACLAVGVYISQHVIDRAQVEQWAEEQEVAV